MSAEQEIVLSPCVGICSLDDNDICIGCFRTGREISDWGDMNNEQKKDVLRLCGERMSDGNSFGLLNPRR
ncbi:MAG TPA: DUF1289 domain-containing protein [Pseudomonadales bacterium]|nr:DUF1289 domain-containing protein [Pseudomonadales bacterium]